MAGAYGDFDKRLGGILPGGAERTDTVKKYMAAPEAILIAAQEAVPAITGGLLGQGSRTDTSINPKMQSAVEAARLKALSEGKGHIDYSDYDSTTPGGLAARLTMGKVGMDEFKTDADGNVTGFTQRYDTDKTPEQAMSEFDIKNPKSYYKPMEALLAHSQGGGVTTHDISYGGKSQPKAAPKPAPEKITVDPLTEPATAYAVQAGDTLTAIAARRGSTVAELVKRNNIANPDLIQVGQMIR